MPHPDEALLHAWLDGDLEPSEASRVEALVATDPAWSSAAAEARGLIAASSRVIRALDLVPANVVPAARRAPRAPRRTSWWLTRVAALLLVVVGASVVWRRDPAVHTAMQANAEPQAVAAPTLAPPTAAPGKTPTTRSAPTKSVKALADASPVVTASSTPGVAPAARALPVPAAPAVLASAENRAAEKSDAPSRDEALVKKSVEDSVTARREQVQGRTLQFSATTAAPSAARAATGTRREDTAISAAGDRCFVPRVARPDSTAIVRFGPGALADSVRVGWVLIADSLLTRPNGQPPLRRVPCPVP